MEIAIQYENSEQEKVNQAVFTWQNGSAELDCQTDQPNLWTETINKLNDLTPDQKITDLPRMVAYLNALTMIAESVSVSLEEQPGTVLVFPKSKFPIFVAKSPRQTKIITLPKNSVQ